MELTGYVVGVKPMPRVTGNALATVELGVIVRPPEPLPPPMAMLAVPMTSLTGLYVPTVIE
jgi:hypothetical protein